MFMSPVERCHVVTKSATREHSENTVEEISTDVKAAPKKRTASRTKNSKDAAGAKKSSRSRAKAAQEATPQGDVDTASTPEDLEEVDVDVDIEDVDSEDTRRPPNQAHESEEENRSQPRRLPSG